MASSNMGLKTHTSILESLCRICGCRLKKASKREISYPCFQHVSLLMQAFNINTLEDDTLSSPSKFCQKCYNAAVRESYSVRVTISTWPAHKRTGDCPVCSLYIEQKKGGRPKKAKMGRPKVDDNKNSLKLIDLVVGGMAKQISFKPNIDLLSDMVAKSNMKSFRGDQFLDPLLLCDEAKPEYLCPICREILDQPVKTKCKPNGHMFCAACLSFIFTQCDRKCPVCMTSIEGSCNSCLTG